MALTPERIKDEASHHGFIGNTDQLVKFARAIEAEVRKYDEALMRRLLEALEGAERDNHIEGISAYRAPIITAARARLAPPPPTA